MKEASFHKSLPHENSILSSQAQRKHIREQGCSNGNTINNNTIKL